MTQFTSQWLDNPPETLRNGRSKWSKRPVAQTGVVAIQRLVGGSRWLTEQHTLWLNDDPAAVGDERFYHALDGWERLEDQLRDIQGFQGCVFGPGEHCPQEAVVNCAACVTTKETVESLERQLGFSA